MRYRIHFLLVFFLFLSCKSTDTQVLEKLSISTVLGEISIDSLGITLIHEHVLVDFIGADLVSPDRYHRDSVIQKVLPHLLALKDHGVQTIFECTPSYLGKDPDLLAELSKKSGINLITNVGYYGAVGGKYLPNHAYIESAKELSRRWIAEFESGVQGASVFPGFIKISVNEGDTLSSLDQKLVQAAGLTHLTTGLTIASHTGTWKTAIQEIRILEKMGVEPSEFIWVHAQAEADFENYLKAAEMGVWISLDGIGWSIEPYVKRLIFAKENRILSKVLISHDAGWYDPGKVGGGEIQPYTSIFEKLMPELNEKGFTQEDWEILLIQNPKKAFR